MQLQRVERHTQLVETRAAPRDPKKRPKIPALILPINGKSTKSKYIKFFSILFHVLILAVHYNVQLLHQSPISQGLGIGISNPELYCSVAPPPLRKLGEGGRKQQDCVYDAGIGQVQWIRGCIFDAKKCRRGETQSPPSVAQITTIFRRKLVILISPLARSTLFFISV